MATSGTATITAGETSVTVAHTFKSADYRWIITPTMNLGGRDWWASDKGATTFKININSADPEVDLTFDWDLVPSIPLAEEGDYYCTVAQVKIALHFAESTYDAEILECIISASALIDSLVQMDDISVPTPVPRNITDAARHFAAYTFRCSRAPPPETPALYDLGMKFLEAWKATYKKGAMQ